MKLEFVATIIINVITVFSIATFATSPCLVKILTCTGKLKELFVANLAELIIHFEIEDLV